METTMPPDVQRHPFDINEMIAGENDPKQRAYLIILNSINNSLMDNTNSTREISTKLDAHLTNFERQTQANNEILNKGKGAWRVLAWVLGGVQIIGLGIWVEAKSDIKSIHEAIVAGQQTDTRVEARLQALEKKQ
jgi:hypothetical protein